MSPYFTHSKTTADAPPAETVMTSPCPEPPVAPVVCSPLEPLFLGMDGNAVIPSPLPSPFLAPVVPDPVENNCSPISPAINLYEVDARRPVVEVTTPERQAAWEAELARSPTPPPTADEVVDAVLAASRANTPVFRLEIQPLTPPPRWVRYVNPPPPTADEVVDTVLAASRANTPVFRLEIQPLTPPPRWVSCFVSAFTNPFGERH
ncbi:hypothetical protein NDA18_002122 [Ustilago nuda]|nr:hypothetical protein NDA18_002122 [Ustilago nuda]